MIVIALFILIMALLGIFSILYSARLILEDSAMPLKAILFSGYLSGLLLLLVFAASIILGFIEQAGWVNFE